MKGGGPDCPKGQEFKYDLEVYLVPKLDNSKSYITNFDQTKMIKQPLQTDEMVVCLENVKLKINDGSYKNFIGVSSLRIDSAMIEEGFYLSFLLIFEIDPSSRNLKARCVESHKGGTITCLTDYQGSLVAV